MAGTSESPWVVSLSAGCIVVHKELRKGRILFFVISAPRSILRALDAPDTGCFTGQILVIFLNFRAFAPQTTADNGRWYRAAYLQDDWKVNRRITINAGVRYDFFSPPVERTDSQAEFYPASPINVAGVGTGAYILPDSKKGIAFSPLITSDLATDNIGVGFSSNRSLLNPQHWNFAPRLGASFQASDRLVFRTGFGLYYDGVENLGNYVNLGANYPFDIEQTFPNGSCNANQAPTATYSPCPGNGLYLETGPAAAAAAPYVPSLTGWDEHIHTPYTMNQSFNMQYAVTNKTTATLGYVGSEARHLAVVVWQNGNTALLPAGEYGGPYTPYPAFAYNIHAISHGAIANYNSLQAKLERRFSNCTFLDTR